MTTNARPEEIGTGAVMNMPGRHVHSTAAQGPTTTGERIRLRREGARRMERMADGRRDPLEPNRENGPAGVGELDAWARALAHLQGVGLTGLPPAHVRRALAALPERYGSVLPRRSAA